MNGVLTVVISPTSNGHDEYMQILNTDTSVNIVLIASKFKVSDTRSDSDKGKGRKK